MIYDLLAEHDALSEALNVICDRQPPDVLSQGEIVPMSIAIGSNGERDYFRGIAPRRSIRISPPAPEL